MRHAKIVATFGPATAGYEITRQLIEAGVDVARVNMSHGDYTVHEATYNTVREVSKDLRKAVALFADLQGPKIRLGRFEDDAKHELAVGDRFTITTEDIKGTKERCSTTLKTLTQDVAPGDTLLIDDGKVSLQALEVTDTDVITEVVVPGPESPSPSLRSRRRMRRTCAGPCAPAST